MTGDSYGGATIRRDIMSLWEVTGDKDNWKELDRYMIALHRFQTEGKLQYRRIISMHGGGSGSKDTAFTALMRDKMNSDIKQGHYRESDKRIWTWPPATDPAINFPPAEKTILKDKEGNPVLNGTDEIPDEDAKASTYTFCWHNRPQFLVWHRPLCMEYEHELQKYDPADGGHEGGSALGLPYFAWEEWDGHTLPFQFTMKTHTVRTNAFAGKDFPAGTQFRNPLHSWYAPVSYKNQIEEYFPSELNHSNCTVRSTYFEDPFQTNTILGTWVQYDNAKTNMKYNVSNALREPNYFFFATNAAISTSIENPHNKFHNYVGGKFERNGTTYYGTMPTDQSSYDPIFWMHHCNVERQLCSWQKIAYKGDLQGHEHNAPHEDVMNTVLYPWPTTEGFLKKDEHFDNSAECGTFRDWFEIGTSKKFGLPYRYDRLHPIQHVKSDTNETRRRLVATISTVPKNGYYMAYLRINPDAYSSPEKEKMESKIKNGKYDYVYKPNNHSDNQFYEFISDISVLTGVGSSCTNCAGKESFDFCFDLSGKAASFKDVENGEVPSDGKHDLLLVNYSEQHHTVVKTVQKWVLESLKDVVQK